MTAQQIGDVLSGLKDQTLLHDQLKHQNTIGPYHPFKSPPDFNLAKKHGRAKRVYLPRGKEGSTEGEVCPCCGLFVEGERVPLLSDLSKIYHLGSGYPLYFQFIKSSIALLVIVFLVNGIYNLSSNAAGKDCSLTLATNGAAQYCVQDYISTYAIANKSGHEGSLEAQLILNLITTIIIIVFFHHIRYEVRKISLAADDETITPSDYTVKLAGVPWDVKTVEIKKWIENFSDEKNQIKVRKITRAYDIAEYVQITKEREKLSDQKNSETNPEVLQALNSQLKTLNDKMKELKKKGLSYARIVYVTFYSAQQAAFIKNYFSKSLARRSMEHIAHMFRHSKEALHGEFINVKKAPEPSDILWENLGINRKEKTRRRRVTIALTCAFVLVSFGIVFVLTWAQDLIANQKGEGSKLIGYVSMVISVVIVIVNYMLGQAIRKLSEYEKHGTFTAYFTGVARKLSAAQFVNTAFTTLIAKLIVTTDVSLDGDVETNTFNFYGKGGLVEGVFYVFISNAFLTPIMNYFDPFYYLKVIQRWKALRNPDDKTLTQKEAHELFEDMPIDIAYKYALLIKTMLLTFFYAPGIPLALVFGILGLALVYWTDKFVLLRRAALPFSLGDDLTYCMIEYLEWTAFVFALGNLVFAYTLISPVTHERAFATAPQWLIWAPIVLSLIHIFVPMDLLNRKWFPIIDEVTELDSYDKARFKFFTDYDIENPITRHRGIKDIKDAIEKLEEGNYKEDGEEGTFGDENANLLSAGANVEEHEHHESEEEHEEGEAHEGHEGQEDHENHFSSLDDYSQKVHTNPCSAIHHNQLPTKGVIATNTALQKGLSLKIDPQAIEEHDSDEEDS